MTRLLSVFGWLLISVPAWSQGKLMLVGGGSEEEGGWSDTPYAWAVEQSTNKKVAVISYSVEDNFIPDYFKSLGAAAADNILIGDRLTADLQETYDLLMQYDVFFFKGGDQSYYYQYFKDTRTEQAIADKFEAGGVMTGTSAGMAILSGVIFTAEHDSVYPDDALRNFREDGITLAGDFLSLLPGFVADSHFTERGRIGRLLAFMANWFDKAGEQIAGIGVDDRTAFCIDALRRGVVYGTGSVSVCSGAKFSAQGNIPLTDSVHAMQLLHGHRVDLTDLQILEGPADYLQPLPSSENGNYQVILSGSEGLIPNAGLLDFFIGETGKPADTVVVVTAPGKAKSFLSDLAMRGVKTLLVETSATSNNSDQFLLRNQIRRASKFLFAENEDGLLFDFFKGGSTGALIGEHIKRNGIVAAFIGEDSRYAGHSFVTNHLSDMYAAYYGKLKYSRGMGLLKASTIMSNTFDAGTSDYYENTTAAIPYAMVEDSAKYGIYLNRNSFLALIQQGDKNYWIARGTSPALLLINPGSFTALATQSVNAGGDVRQYAGFDNMYYMLLNGNSAEAGVPEPSVDKPYDFEYAVGVNPEATPFSIRLAPNPSSSGIFTASISPSNSARATYRVTDLAGHTLASGTCTGADTHTIDLSSFSSGIYILRMTSPAGGAVEKMMKY